MAEPICDMIGLNAATVLSLMMSYRDDVDVVVLLGRSSIVERIVPRVRWW